jgi:uncharacterized membrane protein
MEINMYEANQINNAILDQQVLKYCSMSTDKYKLMSLMLAVSEYCFYLSIMKDPENAKSFKQWLLTEI